MGNLWRFSHDSNAGLGDMLLAAYDRNKRVAKADKPDAPGLQQRRHRSAAIQLAPGGWQSAHEAGRIHGKVVILNFWTTWCAYCSQMESMLADVRAKFSGRDDVVFLAVNADEDETLVAPFLQDQKPGGTLVFADGVNQAFHVESIPTISCSTSRQNRLSHAGLRPGRLCRSCRRRDHKSFRSPCTLVKIPQSDIESNRRHIAQASACELWCLKWQKPHRLKPVPLNLIYILPIQLLSLRVIAAGRHRARR